MLCQTRSEAQSSRIDTLAKLVLNLLTSSKAPLDLQLQQMLHQRAHVDQEWRLWRTATYPGRHMQQCHDSYFNTVPNRHSRYRAVVRVDQPSIDLVSETALLCQLRLSTYLLNLVVRWALRGAMISRPSALLYLTAILKERAPMIHHLFTFSYFCVRG